MSESADIDLMRQFGMLCEDPTCTATHVDASAIADVGFVEHRCCAYGFMDDCCAGIQCGDCAASG